MIKEYKSLFYDKKSGQAYSYFYISEDGELLKMEKENDVFVPIAIMN